MRNSRTRTNDLLVILLGMVTAITIIPNCPGVFWVVVKGVAYLAALCAIFSIRRVINKDASRASESEKICKAMNFKMQETNDLVDSL